MPWNPEQYHKFQAERAAPFDDLLALIAVRPNLTVVDLGCGTGELTARLADHLPDSDVLGIDSSPEMLAKAGPLARPGLRFAAGRLEEMRGQWDVVFSHAAIHWVDDHPRLIPYLLSLVKPGGQLAVQMPSNHGHLSHTAALELAGQAPFREALNGWSRRSPVLSIDVYAELLFQHGGRDIVIFEKVYPNVLESVDGIIEWVRGTLLVPYLERLPAEWHEAFLTAYRAKLAERWPAGPVYYAFRRTLFAARRGD